MNYEFKSINVPLNTKEEKSKETIVLLHSAMNKRISSRYVPF